MHNDSDVEARDWTTVPTSELPEQLEAARQRYYTHLENTGRLELWRRSTRAYHGLDSNGGWSQSSAVTFGGEAGENALIHENHFRSLLQHIKIMATGDRPAFQARALRADYKAMEQALLAERLMDYFFTEKELEDRAEECAEISLHAGEAWYALTWDHNRGEQVAVEGGPEDETGEPAEPTDEMAEGVEEQAPRIVYEGDMVAEAFHPIDVIRDPVLHLYNQRWVVLRRRANRFDLMAEYPERAHEIADAEMLEEERQESLGEFWQVGGGDYEGAEYEHVYVYELYRKGTPNLPEGRHAQVVGSVVLFDGPLPYREIPVHPIAPAVEMQRGFGYSHAWDLLGIQQALNSTASSILTKHDAFAINNVIAPDGSNVTASMIAGGLQLIEYTQNMDKPEVLDLDAVGEDSLKLLDHWVRAMEELSGVNSIARGNPEGSLKGASGTAMALIHAQAVKFNSGFQKAYVRLLESVGTAALDLIKAFATTPRLAEIAGDDARPHLEEFSRDNVSEVRRVVVDLANPMLRTTSGKVDVADKLAQLFKDSPDPITKEQYLAVMKTGRLEPIYKHQVTQRLNITQENEHLRRGEPVVALMYDDHALHIREHSCVLNDPTIRFNQDLVMQIQEHMAEHERLWVTATQEIPVALAATGQQPAPMPMPPPGMAPPGAPPGPEGPPPGGPGGGMPGGPSAPPEAGPPTADVPGAPPTGPEGVPMPQMPIDPMTGEPVAA